MRAPRGRSRPLIFTVTGDARKRKALKELGAEVVHSPPDRYAPGKSDLAEIVRELGRARLHEVTVETGGKLPARSSPRA